MSIWAKLSGNAAFNSQSQPAGGPVATENVPSNQRFYYSSSSGQMISSDGTGYVIPNLYDIVADKHEFIPKESATDKLKSVIKESNNIKTAYEENISKLNAHYQKLLEDSKVHYETLIDDLKKRAVRHVDIQKQMKQQIEDKLTKELKQSEDTLEELRDNMADLNRKYQDEVRKLKTKNSELEHTLQQVIHQAKDRDLKKETKSLLYEMVTNIESEQTNEFYKNTISSMRKDMETLIEDYSEALNQQKVSHQQEIARLKQQDSTRKQCKEVMEYLLSTLEITEMSQTLQSMAALSLEVEGLNNSVNSLQEELSKKQKEIENLTELQRQLSETIIDKDKEIALLLETYEKEKQDFSSTHEERTSHLKSKFNQVLKQMKASNNEMEVKLCLSDMINEVMNREIQLLHSIHSSTAGTWQVDHEKELSALSSEYEKKISLLQQELTLNRQKVNDLVQSPSQLSPRHEAKNAIPVVAAAPVPIPANVTEKLDKLQSESDRLEVELTMMSMVNRITEFHYSRNLVTTAVVLSPSEELERERLQKELKNMKKQLSTAQHDLQKAQEELEKKSHAPNVGGVVVEENADVSNLKKQIEIAVKEYQEIENKMIEPIKNLQDGIIERDIYKNQIKDWTTQFRAENGREPEVGDKALIRDKYQNYKVASLKVKELEAIVQPLEKEKEDKRLQIQQLEEQLALLLGPQAGQQTVPSAATAAGIPRAASSGALTRLASASAMKHVVETVDAEVQVVTNELRGILVRKQSSLEEKPPSDAASPRATTTTAAPVVQENKPEMAEITKEQFDELMSQHNEALEQLDDQIFAMKEEITKLKATNQEIETEKNFINQQLETLIKEKRTDVLKRFEEELATLNKKSAELNETVTHLTIEKQKLDTRVTELKERAERAEQELRERDAREQQALQPNDEKFQLKGQINKQRDQIILKSKAATAGWDAAASADEKLEIEVQKAYQKGLKEEREKHKSDLDGIHSALEGKETRITELLVSIAEMEKKVMKAETEKKEMAAQVEGLKLEVADAISGIQQIAAANLGGGGGGGQLNEDGELVIPPSAAELEQAREQLDAAQEELVGLMDRCDRLEAELEVARRKNRLFERLATMTGLTSGKAAAVAGGKGSGDSGSDLSKYDLNDVIQSVKRAITKGTNLWKSNLKDQCYDVYLDVCIEITQRIMTEDLVKPVRDSIDSGKLLGAQNKQRGAVTFRKALDKFLSDSSQPNYKNNEENAVANARSKQSSSIDEQNQMNNGIVKELVEQLDNLENSFLEQGYTKEKNPSNSSSAGTEERSPRGEHQSGSSLLQRAKAAEAQVQSLRKQLAAVIAATAQAPAAAAGGGHGGDHGARPTTSSRGRGGAGPGIAAGIVASAAAGGGGADPAEVRRLNRKIKDLEQQLKNKDSGSSGGNANAELKAMQLAEKQLQKKLKDQETLLKRESKNIEMRAVKAENALQKIQGTYNTIVSERDTLKQENAKLFQMTSEIGAIKAKAEKCEQLESTLQQKEQDYQLLQEQFKKESQLRKKYKNDLEDLKGAIRVYARCRPMAKYELEKGCKSVVEIKDETSMKVITSRGEKEFEFDAVFSPSSTQDQVFEDTKRLVESCIDGFNVCVFAYGQTGSGKTFTMTGSSNNPGLTPKAIYELYRLIDERVHLQVKVTTYFVELYNDNLVDLFWILDNNNVKGPPQDPPKLEIKMDAKKMVFIRNAVIKDANSPEELMELFNKGNLERHTGATKMNAESSRSHSIFAIMVESFDTTSKRTIVGKLSLVDLAGSERADKTGASAERLREAQSINKSLSALGDVIAALSEGGKDKFIPYRNNKLTQLMQDSLGGNAKTLMFVNFSPADYNADETSTSLMYAARVKKIVNNASKQAESEEVARLKAIIKKLQSGQAVAVEEINKEEAVEDAPVEVADDGKVYDGY